MALSADSEGKIRVEIFFNSCCRKYTGRGIRLFHDCCPKAFLYFHEACGYQTFM